jgi:N-acetylmuramoyl-L-alanine amidase
MKKLLVLFIFVVLGGCATSFPIDTTYTSKSQDSRVQYLILHYTAGGFPGSLKILTEGAVSSHYLVSEPTENGPAVIYRLVDENRRAYHAGVSYWKGANRLNASSIGIEIVNIGYRDTPQGRTWAEFPKGQMDAVIALVKKIVAEHQIPPERVLGHSDIAPDRKEDPGPRFPWKRLADEGLVQWPDEKQVTKKRPEFEAQLPDVTWFQKKLALHGFATEATGILDKYTRRALSAFQMKYRPAKYEGEPDAETAAILDVITQTPQTQQTLQNPQTPAPGKKEMQNSEVPPVPETTPTSPMSEHQPH